MKQKIRGVGVGTISLIMIFSVLCLTIFAMLTLSTANAERVLSERTSSFVKGYYEADSEATTIRAALIESYSTGVLPDIVAGVEIVYERVNGGVEASFVCEVNNVQHLIVKLFLGTAGDSVLEWRTGNSGGWMFDDSLTLFDQDALEIIM